MDDERRFIFRLASHLKMTVEYLVNNMTYKEFQEWMTYYSLEPFISDRIELQIAQLHQSFASAHFKGSSSHIDYMISLSPDQKQSIKYNKMNQSIKSFLRGSHG